MVYEPVAGGVTVVVVVVVVAVVVVIVVVVTPVEPPAVVAGINPLFWMTAVVNVSIVEPVLEIVACDVTECVVGTYILVVSAHIVALSRDITLTKH